MAEELIKGSHLTKTEKYQSLLPQIKALIEGEDDVIANLANVSAALKEYFDFLWVGFYLVKDENLVLGPFQGPIACTRIARGKGVCGQSWEKNQVLIVDDVDLFPGHIACSSSSKSEIVIPISRNGKVIAVLDIDSEHLAFFNEIDQKYLQELVEFLTF